MVIDFHSHILPCVDHGSRSLTQTKNQLEIVKNAGVDAIVATSHFYPHQHRVEEFFEAVSNAASKISEIRELEKSPAVYLGAEVLACEFLDKIEGLDKLCLRGTRVLLLEMPYAASLSNNLLKSVENIMSAGYSVVLAHIDRYVKKYEEEIDYLIGAGAVAQINADSLTSFFQRKKLMQYINGGCVCAFGSDLHGDDSKDYKPFSNLERYVGKENYLSVMKNSELLLAGALSI